MFVDAGALEELEGGGTGNRDGDGRGEGERARSDSTSFDHSSHGADEDLRTAIKYMI